MIRLATPVSSRPCSGLPVYRETSRWTSLTAKTSLIPAGRYWPNIKLQKKLTQMFLLSVLCFSVECPDTTMTRTYNNRQWRPASSVTLHPQFYKRSRQTRGYYNTKCCDRASGVDKALFRSSSVGLTRSKEGLKVSPCCLIRVIRFLFR